MLLFRLLLLLFLFGTLLQAQQDGAHDRTHGDDYKLQRVAIVGAGIGGSSAAYFLKELLQDEVEIFVFERENYVGGRLNDILVEGVRLEIGGSIFHECNKHMSSFVQMLGLQTEKPLEGLLGIWNGKEFIIRESSWQLLTLAKFVYRYATSPFVARGLAETVKDKFVQIYNVLGNSTFDQVIDLFKSVNLDTLVHQHTRSALHEAGISELFIDELVTAITRVNYAQDTRLNALAGYVSMIGSGEGLYGVKGGNKQVVAGLLQRAQAVVQKNTHVISVDKARDSSMLEYIVRTKNVAGSVEVEHRFDAVIFAAPLEAANISLDFLSDPAQTPKPTNVVANRPYQHVHVTAVAGRLNPTFFGLSPTEDLPAVILTTENPSMPFNSLAAKQQISESVLVYKLFSRQPLPDTLLDRLFLSRNGAIFRHEWAAYPVLAPDVSVVGEWPPISLAKGVYYVNALESAVSTMETETIASKNIAKQVAQYLRTLPLF